MAENNNTMQIFCGLEAIRHRPAMYIGGTFASECARVLPENNEQKIAAQQSFERKMAEKGIRPRSREDREQKLRNVAAKIIRHNRRIAECAKKQAAYYNGVGDQPVRQECLHIQTNPKRNGASALLEELGEALKAYPRGEYPSPVLTQLFGSILSLIEDTLEPICSETCLNISATVVVDFKNYLEAHGSTTQEEHAKNIDEHIRRWQRRFCQNSDAFYRLHREFERRSGRRPGKNVPRPKNPVKSSASEKKRMRNDAVAWRIQEAEAGRFHSAQTVANHFYALMKADPNLYIGGYTEPTEASKIGANDNFVKTINNHTPKPYKRRKK